MLNREEVFKLNNETINESFSKLGDSFRGQVIIDIPKSMITKIRNNAKKELNFDSVESYSDITVCDLIIEYIKATFVNPESIPVSKLFGIDAVGEPGDATGEIEMPEAQPSQQVQPTEISADPMEEIETSIDDIDTPQSFEDDEF